MLPISDDEGEAPVPTELRGMTDQVLVWVEEQASFSTERAQSLADQIDDDILEPMRQLFNYAEPPGIDSDPRLYIVLIHKPEFSTRGYFARTHTDSRAVYPRSNQREMMVINLARHKNTGVNDRHIVSAIVHEYQHILLYHRDTDEDLWLNEALSSFSQYFMLGFDTVYGQSQVFLDAPETGLTHWSWGDDRIAKYGAGVMFLIFVAEQYGSEVLRELQAERSDGWRSVQKILAESVGVSADEVFADWVLANYFLDAERDYGYRTLAQDLRPPQPVATFRDFPALHTSSISQYSSDYYSVDVRGADQLRLRLTQAPESHLIETTPYEGDFFYYAVTTDVGDSRLTRRFDLRRFRRAWLEFRVWYDLEEFWDYGYIQVSYDGGENWDILQSEHTTDQFSNSRSFGAGYTGNSNGWVQERIDLSSYVHWPILLRFEVLTFKFTSYRGMAIDDLRIDAIGFHDSFEISDDAWNAEGWIRTDNRLPQRTWVQVVQDTADGLQVSRSLLTGSGEMTVDVLSGAAKAVIAISPIVPQTPLETQYTLEVALIDADGAAMSVSRGCTVTTTHALNFRDTPNGNRIGLLPQNTSVDALERKADWFRVDYAGKHGWISAGYVTMQGSCA